MSMQEKGGRPLAIVSLQSQEQKQNLDGALNAKAPDSDQSPYTKVLITTMALFWEQIPRQSCDLFLAVTCLHSVCSSLWQKENTGTSILSRYFVVSRLHEHHCAWKESMNLSMYSAQENIQTQKESDSKKTLPTAHLRADPPTLEHPMEKD